MALRSLQLAASLAGSASAFSAYRLRLAGGLQPPEGLFGDAEKTAWEVRELRFFADGACETSPLEVLEPVASVGQDFGRAALAFDSDNGTSWSSACRVSEDASAACSHSWSEGAWIGARLAGRLGCVLLEHKGASVGLLLEGWQAGEWAPLQGFPAPSEPRVQLSRLGGGGCTAAAAALAPEGRQLLPSCVDGAQWRLVMQEVVLSWEVNELLFYKDSGCRQLAEGFLPITIKDEPLAARAFADGDSATSWSASCSVSDRDPGGSCTTGRLWVGLAFREPVDVKCIYVSQDFQVRYGSGSSARARFSLQAWRQGAWQESLAFSEVVSGGWRYLPQQERPTKSMWRLINDGLVSSAWVLYDLAFMADEACSEVLKPSKVGAILSSETPAKEKSEVPKAFDGDDESYWMSSCAPCQPGVVYIGLSFDEPVEVGCVRMRHGSDSAYWPAFVRLEYWDASQGWRYSRTFPRLQSGLQFLNRNWEKAGTRFAVQNEAVAASGWRLREVKFFRDAECTQQVVGRGFGSDGDYADVARAYDGRTDTFWHGDCCYDYQGLVECPGCIARQAWLGMILLDAEEVRCVHLVQVGGLTLPPGTRQPAGPLLFSSQRISLQMWNSFRFEGVFEWENIASNVWVELSVGKPSKILGVAEGCGDSVGWTKCGVSEANCDWYRENGLCNATYFDDTACDGLTMILACKSSCCLCQGSNAPHCPVQAAPEEPVPVWLAPVAAVLALLLILAVLGCFCCWRRRTCHDRKCCCRRCCRFLDVLARRRTSSAHTSPDKGKNSTAVSVWRASVEAS